MPATTIMVIAGEASGDALAAELVSSLRVMIPLNWTPTFFGAGGQNMAAANVELLADMTQHSAIGLGDVIRKYQHFRKIFYQLLNSAIERQPDLIVLVDFGAFNLRFATAIRKYVNNHRDARWSPRIVQFVSPQVWASRAYRAKRLEEHVNCLLCLFPFEKPWYAKNAPKLRVEFVGHPIFDRYANFKRPNTVGAGLPQVLLLPGSRRAELNRHLPVMLAAAAQISQTTKASFNVIVPTETLATLAKQISGNTNINIQIGGLAESLSQATIAIASTGTVLLECAFFGVPTVAMYKTSWGTYQIGKRIVQVKYLSMPNILADSPVYPEFVQDDATPDAISRAALDLLQNAERRDSIKRQLSAIIASLGGGGASQRAAATIRDVMLDKWTPG